MSVRQKEEEATSMTSNIDVIALASMNNSDAVITLTGTIQKINSSLRQMLQTVEALQMENKRLHARVATLEQQMERLRAEICRDKRS